MAVHWQAVVSVALDPMMLFTAEAIRIDVHGHAAEMQKVMKEPVTDVGGDVVPFPHR